MNINTSREITQGSYRWRRTHNRSDGLSLAGTREAPAGTRVDTAWHMNGLSDLTWRAGGEVGGGGGGVVVRIL